MVDLAEVKDAPEISQPDHETVLQRQRAFERPGMTDDKFAATLEQQGQPFDFLLYATITSGTTRENKDYQRDYLLTMELVDVHNGQYDKQSARVSVGAYARG